MAGIRSGCVSQSPIVKFVFGTVTEQLKNIMSVATEWKTGKVPQGVRALPWVGLLFLWLFASSAQALVVTIDLGWGYNYDGAGTSVDLGAEYNLQVGSIVQVIMYDSATYSSTLFQAGEADDNFDLLGYTAGGDPVYNPLSTPDGHLIAYTTTIQVAPYADGQGDTWYQIYAQFEVIGTYDSLYIRVFGETDFPQSMAEASYWGLSDVQVRTNTFGMWYVPIVDNTDAPNLIYFEVIPEPGTMGLVVLGGIGLLAESRRRRKRGRKEPGAAAG